MGRISPVLLRHVQRERGFGLLLALCVTAFLMLFALSVTFSSIGNLSMTNDLNNHGGALRVAEAGFAAAKEQLRGVEFELLMSTAVSVSQYVPYDEPPPSEDSYAYFIRNPLHPLEAMTVDFENHPQAIGQRTVYGLLTPPEGVALRRS